MKYITIAALSLIVVYIMFSFVQMDMNATQWDLELRIAYILVSFIGSVAGIGLYTVFGLEQNNN